MLGQAIPTINPAYLGNRTKRAIAFFIDIFPITFLLIMLYREFGDYDILLDAFLADHNNPAIRAPFMAKQNEISMISLVTYIFYAFALEASSLQATYGKHLMGLKVVKYDGAPLSTKDALWRNLFKVVSQTAFNIGFFWILFDSNKRGWHDMFSQTLVVEREYAGQLTPKSTPIEENIFPQFQSTPKSIKSIYEGNQHNLLFSPAITTSEFKQLKSEYEAPEMRYYEYYTAFIYRTRQANSHIQDDVYWNNGTLGQKILQLFAMMDQEINNSNFGEFLKENTDALLAVSELLKFFDVPDLLEKYQLAIKMVGIDTELMVMGSTEDAIIDEQQWMSFLNDSSSFPEMEALDASYRSEYQQDFYQKICDYVESNQSQFI